MSDVDKRYTPEPQDLNDELGKRRGVRPDEEADLGYGAENFTEVEESIWRNTQHAIRAISRRIEGLATKSELQSVWKSAEKTFAYKKVCHDALNMLAKDQDSHKTYTAMIEITSSELLALNATPKEIVPAPQPNQYLDIVSAQLYLPFNSTPYTIGANNDLSLEFDGGDQITQFEGTGLLDQSSDQRRSYHHPTVPMNVFAGSAMLLKMLDSEITLGNSPLKIEVCYRIKEVIL